MMPSWSSRCALPSICKGLIRQERSVATNESLPGRKGIAIGIIHGRWTILVSSLGVLLEIELLAKIKALAFGMTRWSGSSADDASALVGVGKRIESSVVGEPRS